ncbi:hypothetical protein D3C78_1101560 [compost metagenome]
MTIDWGKVITAEDKAAEALAEVKKSIAAKRYEQETRGIEVMGMQVDTGRDSQGLIAGAALQGLINPEYTVNWKCQSGEFISLTSQQIIGLASTVRAHVQACFDREGEILTALANSEYTPEMLEEGWPE